MKYKRPLGVWVIFLMWLSSALLSASNVFLFRGALFPALPLWMFALAAVFQGTLSWYFFSLNKLAYKVVIWISHFYFVIYAAGMTIGAVQIFQDGIAKLLLILSVPMVFVFFWVIFYLRKPRIKKLFT